MSTLHKMQCSMSEERGPPQRRSETGLILSIPADEYYTISEWPANQLQGVQIS